MERKCLKPTNFILMSTLSMYPIHCWINEKKNQYTNNIITKLANIYVCQSKPQSTQLNPNENSKRYIDFNSISKHLIHFTIYMLNLYRGLCVCLYFRKIIFVVGVGWYDNIKYG